MDTLRLSVVKHRFKHEIKAQTISKYRKKEFIQALKAPLNNEPSTPSNQQKISASSSSAGNLLFIRHLSSNLSPNCTRKSVHLYLTEEKRQLLSAKDYKSERFNRYVSGHVYPSHLHGRYLLGYRVSTLDWLLDVLRDLAQCHNFSQMLAHVKHIVNKFTKIK
jgi:hypothetical protein